jgi:NitT/TauT family transport system substrate-binding protein
MWRWRGLGAWHAVGAVAVLVAALGSTAPQALSAVGAEKATLTLNFLAGGPQAGFMYAKALGYYRDAGIDLTIQEGQGSITTAQIVASNRTDFGYADAPSAMAVRAKGGPIKIVAAILQTNAFAIVSLKKENITRVGDLVGKTIAVQPGTAQTALLDAVFSANHIAKDQVKIINVDPSALVGTLLQGKADAILAGADFQSIQLRDRGVEINELFYRDIGVPTVGLSIVVNNELIRRDPGLVARFVEASLRGWDAARAHPDAAAQAVADQFPAAGTKDQFLKQLQVDVKFLCAPGATALGAPPAAVWNRTVDLLVAYQHLPRLPISDFFTPQFLPKARPKCG